MAVHQREHSDDDAECSKSYFQPTTNREQCQVYLNIAEVRRRKAKPKRKSEHHAEVLPVRPCSRNKYE